MPDKVGSFVVGIPTEVIEAYRKEHATETTDAVFRKLISDQEIEQMKNVFGRLNLSIDEQIPFTGDPISLGTPTFEGKEGKKFWSILVSR